MTIIEDTHLTLAVILFKVEANNTLIFLPLQIYEKELTAFPFQLIFIIPWFKAGYLWSYYSLLFGVLIQEGSNVSSHEFQKAKAVR